MTRLRISIALIALLVCSPIAAHADVVLDWNAIAVSTLTGQGQSPFAQARFMAITQLRGGRPVRSAMVVVIVTVFPPAR